MKTIELTVIAGLCLAWGAAGAGGSGKSWIGPAANRFHKVESIMPGRPRR